MSWLGYTNIRKLFTAKNDSLKQFTLGSSTELY